MNFLGDLDDKQIPVWMILVGALALFRVAIVLVDTIVRKRRAARMVELLTAAHDGNFRGWEVHISLSMSELDTQIEAYRVDADLHKAHART